MDGPDLIAALDQRRSELGALAGLLGVYFAALVNAGFTRDEALVLIADYQDWLCQPQGGADA